ncbi:hypothetical protein GCK72_003681 [Caenorhabditis remanei]|uniref:Uncharacterized protein n=1 Tax=Caenorhabditis remanei TaxID=31234 RepID=A0A6A5HA65_CAERE|nr:hypothetical protein GCK72_003681 [Caenorhabditis remanei]KAF1763736.1 hypothetical protein GCK72_003681 [Caenorhabditis remanei]
MPPPPAATTGAPLTHQDQVNELKPKYQAAAIARMAFGDRVVMDDTHSLVEMFNQKIPFTIEQLEFTENKIRMNGETLVIEYDGDQILVTSKDQIIRFLDSMEDIRRNIIRLYLGRVGTTAESLVILDPKLLENLMYGFEVTFSMSIKGQLEPEHWEKLKLLTGNLQFCTILSPVTPEIFEVPIIAESKGITLYGEQPNEVIFASNNFYFLNKDHVPAAKQIREIYEHWKSIKRQEGMFTFECTPEVYQDYKTQFKTWGRNYKKVLLSRDGKAFRKLNCLDLHTDKHVMLFSQAMDNSENLRVSMAIHPKDIRDAVAAMFQRIFG